MTGFGGQSNGKKSKSSRRNQINFQKWFNQAIYFHQTGKLRDAELTYKKLIAAGLKDPSVFSNLGIICKNSGRIKEALDYYEQALEIEPNDPKAYSNIGNLYREIGQLDQALRFTLKSVELNQSEPTAQLNLGSIYRELGQTDQALAATVRSIKLDPANLDAHQNLKSLASDIKTNTSNTEDVREAYEILLNREDLFHRKLCPLFIELFLEKIQEAAQSDPLITESNQAFQDLASDWRFRKSLTLLTPPHEAIEEFLTRLRKEVLIYATNYGTLPQNLKPLIEALSTQCFLNEYVYWQSEEEYEWISNLISESSNSEDQWNQYLPIIGCYVPLNNINACRDYINRYPITNEESRTLLKVQFKEVEEETMIKSQLREQQQITNQVSLEVQDMYEENPYPRYRYADFTHPQLTKSIAEAISKETTISKLEFTDELLSPNSNPKLLIAGCGTGNQIVNASRYRNTKITAIDISRSSLAYAMRKSREYKMNHVNYKQLDILNANQLQEEFDIIECSGVLHHMEDPSKGLAALTRQLKSGGYIKLGLYSSFARREVSKARHLIQKSGIQSTPEGIRDFRRKIFNGELEDIKSISTKVNDFYALSECRDLCFHVQEHQFTTELLKELLKAENLVFCGFMLPKSIQAAYRKQFPEDQEATSLSNWGEFEQHNQSTFQSMYQFWAYKPL